MQAAPCNNNRYALGLACNLRASRAVRDCGRFQGWDAGPARHARNPHAHTPAPMHAQYAAAAKGWDAAHAKQACACIPNQCPRQIACHIACHRRCCGSYGSNSARNAVARSWHAQIRRGNTQPVPSGHGPGPPSQRPRAVGACMPGCGARSAATSLRLGRRLDGGDHLLAHGLRAARPSLTRLFVSSCRGRADPTLGLGHAAVDGAWRGARGCRAVAGSCKPRSSARGRRAP
jgi:hypothetical protein